MADVVFQTIGFQDIGYALTVTPETLLFLTLNLKPEENASITSNLTVPINAYDLDAERLYDFALISARVGRRRQNTETRRYLQGWSAMVDVRRVTVGQVLAFSWIAVGHRVGLRLYNAIVGERLIILARIFQPNGIPRRPRTKRVEVNRSPSLLPTTTSDLDVAHLSFSNPLLKKMTLDVVIGDQLNGSLVHFNLRGLVYLKYGESLPEQYFISNLVHALFKVVAAVKSCTPNGLGDMILTIKDPTATISATVHRKVLRAGEFGKLITAGSILILQKVVAFPSSSESCHLNITSKNVVKVISVNCEIQPFQDTNLDGAQVIEKAGERKNSASTNRSKDVETSAFKFSILSDLVDSVHRASGSFDQWREISVRAAQKDSEALVAAANKEDRYSNVGSAPSTSQNSRYAWQKHGPELKRMLTEKFQTRVRNPDSRSSSASENLSEGDRWTSNGTQKHGPAGSQIGVTSDPSLVDSLLNREIANPKDGERCTQARDTEFDLKQHDPANTGSVGIKKRWADICNFSSGMER